MNRFWVDPKLFNCFPGMHLAVAVVDGLDNHTQREAINAMWAAAWRDVNAHGVDDARKHPYVDAWRRDFARLGVSMKRFPVLPHCRRIHALSSPGIQLNDAWIPAPLASLDRPE